MLQLSKIIILGILFLSPFCVTAAYNTVTFDANTDIYLWGVPATITIQSGSMLASYTVTAQSLELDMENGSTLVLVSSDKKQMNNNLDIDTVCRNESSTLTLSSNKTQGISVSVGKSCPDATPAVVPLGLSVIREFQNSNQQPLQDTEDTSTTTPAVEKDNLNSFYSMTTTELKAEIVKISSLIAELLLQLSQTSETSTEKLSQNLQYGSEGKQVKLLQTWLSNDLEVYPEAIISGWFGPLTKKAVIKFQEKYKEEILTPVGLFSGTGYVGPSTRAKLNSFIGGL